MTSSAKLTHALLFAATLALACGTDKAPSPTPAAASETGASASETGQAPAQDGAPKIASDAAVHEFGGIKPTDSIEHVFTIKNVGTADLKIERVQRT